MQLEFIPVEKFYFALTLAVRTLEELETPSLVENARSQLSQKYGQPSTVAPGKQNTFNYVFSIPDIDNSPANQLIVSVSDWQNKLRLSSDYGWMLDSERKPVRTDKFYLRSQFSQELRNYLEEHLQIQLKNLNTHLQR